MNHSVLRGECVMFMNPVCLLGGNVHIHYTEEKCYDEEIFFYHLGCHQWVSVGENLSHRKCRVLERVSWRIYGDKYQESFLSFRL